MRLFIVALLSLTYVSTHAESQRFGTMELLNVDSAIPLSQSDFDSGSYRITKPGYYYFTENVSFRPIAEAEATRTDIPPIDAWFTALSVECDNVIIDLNTKTFECAQEFINTNSFKVFSLIELSNSPFPHFDFAYRGETKLKTAHNVEIKNGIIGRSSHHGIHGNNNSDIYVHDVVIRDWEVAGIALNSLLNGEIKDSVISGIEHKVPFTGQLALMKSAEVMLKNLVRKGDVVAASYMSALQPLITDPTFNGETYPSGASEGNCFGIFLNRAFDIGPVVPRHCADGTVNSVVIDNVTICNVKCEMLEVIGIANNNGVQLKGFPYGILRWEDAYPNGVFAPNALIKAQVYGANAVKPQLYPAGFADNILSDQPDEALFLSHVKPVFNADDAGHRMKGAYGIRVDCGHGVTIKDCRIINIQGLGVQGKYLSDIAANENYAFEPTRYNADARPFEVGRYTGNDVYGISLAACRNCHVINTKVLECWSRNGHVHGIAVINGSEANIFENCISSDHYAHLDNPTDLVNPSSLVTGVFVDNTAHANSFRNCVSQSLQSPRGVYGFLVQNSRDTRFENCQSSDHAATSAVQLNVRKRAVGFASVGSETTFLSGCYAGSVRCTNESAATEQTMSEAVGILVESKGNTNDLYLHVEKSKGACCDAGNGFAAGLLLNGAVEACIMDSSFDRNHVAGPNGVAYGIYDTASITESLFMRNMAFGNKTRNYLIRCAAGQSLPMTTALYGRFGNLYQSNGWNNVSFETQPGGHYVGEIVYSR
jgi:hypothetical protein